MTLKFIIFDLDDTLYPRSSGLMQEIGRRIQIWVCDYFGLSWEEGIALRRDYFHRYGTTMGGLIAEHDLAPHDYLAFVHDIPVREYLDPNPALAAMLDTIPLRKAVYTNATSEYAWRVLQALEVADRFKQVIGIEEAGFRNKASRDGYERVLALLDVEGPECIMVEDIVQNLRPAKMLGLTTVLVDAEPDEHVDFVVQGILEIGQVLGEVFRARGS